MLSYKSLLNPLSSFDGNLLHQLVARRKVRELERLNQQQFSQERKNQIIELSLQHSITSQYTSFLISEEVQDYPDSADSKPRLVPISKSVDIRPKGSRAHDPHMNNNRMGALSPGGSPNLQNGWRTASGGITRTYSQNPYGNNQNSMFSNNSSSSMNYMSRSFTPVEDRSSSMFSNQFYNANLKQPQYSTYPGTSNGSYGQHRLNGSASSYSSNNVSNYYFNNYNYPNNGNHSFSNTGNGLRSNNGFQFGQSYGNRGDLLNGLNYDNNFLSNGISSGDYTSSFALKLKLESFLSSQQEDGSWNLDSEVASFLGISLEELQRECTPDQNNFWATALVIVFLDISYYENFSSWEQHVENAKLFLSQNTDSNYWFQMASQYLERRY